jgi:DNA-binding MarR family transcriptional regulator
MRQSSKKTASGKKAKVADPIESDFGKRILFSLRRIIRAVDIHSRMLVQGYQITGPQLACLIVVVEKESTTATEIAKKISLSTSTIIGILDRLEGKGLLRRERDKKDRRVIHIFATDSGRKMIANMPYPLQQPLSKALQCMSNKELESIAVSLERLVHLMDVESVSADPLLEPERFTKV